MRKQIFRQTEIRRLTGLMTLVVVLSLGSACGTSKGGDAGANDNSIAAGNSNSGKTSSKQTDTSPVTISVDALMSEFKNNPSATYEKYKDRAMTVSGKLKSVTMLDGASGTWDLQLQTLDGSDFSGAGRFSCASKASFDTGKTYEAIGRKLDALKQANQLDAALPVTVNGVYKNLDETLRGNPPASVYLSPCDMIGAGK